MQRKWFVYHKDHHEGPYTQKEIFDQYQEKILTKDTYIWADGMADWKPILEVNELQNVFTSLIKPLPTEQLAETRLYKNTSLVKRIFWLFFCTSAISLGYLGIRTIILHDDRLGLFEGLRYFAQQHYRELEGIQNIFPFLAKWISPIPPLADVSQEDYEQLKKAASANLLSGGKIYAAVSKNVSLQPTLYFASNLPDETALTIHLTGVPETLLNKTNAFFKTVGILKNKLAIVKITSPSVFPVGEYSVEIFLSRYSSAAKYFPNLSEKSIVNFRLFIGGEKNATYQKRLAEYHALLVKKTSQELHEVGQYLTTLEVGFSQMTAKFKQIFKIPSVWKRKQEWKHFDAKWTPLYHQIGKVAASWDQANMQLGFFYPKFYLLLKPIVFSLIELHRVLDYVVAAGLFRNIEINKKINFYIQDINKKINFFHSQYRTILKNPVQKNGLPTLLKD